MSVAITMSKLWKQQQQDFIIYKFWRIHNGPQSEFPGGEREKEHKPGVLLLLGYKAVGLGFLRFTFGKLKT